MNSWLNIATKICQFFFFLFTLSLFIYGCGGGGGSRGNGGDGNSLTIQGIFVDGPVEGLVYKTATLSGVTDVNGTFKYREQELEVGQETIIIGEIITFSVGDIVLGHGIAKEIVTPVDLVDVAVEELDPEQNPRVTNISRFLISLDIDGDPDNGISISREIREACRGRSIDFNLSVADFETDPEVVSLFVTLNGLGVFSDIGERKLYPVLQSRNHLKESLREIRSIYLKNWEWIDSNNDGTNDYVIKYTYDANGILIKERHDITNDGIVEYSVNYTYDTNRNPIKKERIYFDDKMVDYVYNYEYDANGNVIKEELDENDDGVIEAVQNFTFTYDANGNVIKEEIAYNDIGTIDNVKNFAYDHNWYLIREEVVNSYGWIEYIKNFTYDHNWYLIREETDYSNDGVIDGVKNFTYNANGNLIKETHDLDADGKIDYVATYSDHLFPWVKEERDLEADGKIDYVAEYKYTDDYGSEEETKCSRPDMIGPEGGVLKVTATTGSAINGVNVEIPEGTLLSCRTLYISDQLVDPIPRLPVGFKPFSRDRFVFDIEISGSSPVSMPMQMSIPIGEIPVAPGEILSAYYYDNANGKWQIVLPEEVGNDKMVINTTYHEKWSWGTVSLAEVDDIETLEHLLEEELGIQNWNEVNEAINQIIDLLVADDFKADCTGLNDLNNQFIQLRDEAIPQLERFQQDLGDKCGICNVLSDDFLTEFGEYIELRMKIFIAEIFKDVDLPGTLADLLYKMGMSAAIGGLWEQIESAPCNYRCLVENSQGMWIPQISRYTADLGIIIVALANDTLNCK